MITASLWPLAALPSLLEASVSLPHPNPESHARSTLICVTGAFQALSRGFILGIHYSATSSSRLSVQLRRKTLENRIFMSPTCISL